MKIKRSNKLKAFKKAALPVVLSLVIFIQGCVPPAWVGQVGTIVAALAPAVINILQIIALAEGKPFNKSLGDKITADAANIKVLANDFATASAAAAPNACAQLKAGLATFGADQATVNSLIQVADPATQAKASLLFNLTNGAFSTVEALIPSCNAPAALRESLAKATPLVDGNKFVTTYNAALVVPTGKASVDAYTKSHKIHAHNLFVRMLPFWTRK
jgi:hypothetical protein